MEANHQQPETADKKPTQTEDVDRLISRKQAERAQEGFQAVQKSAEGIQTEVAEIIGGVEAPKEKISEREGESGEKGDIKAATGQAGGDEGVQPVQVGVRKGIPSEEIMIRKIRIAINTQIKLEMKKAIKLQKHLTTGNAQEYNTTIAKIRRLKETLSSLATSAYETIKNIYLRYFGPDGRRKKLDEMD